MKLRDPPESNPTSQGSVNATVQYFARVEDSVGQVSQRFLKFLFVLSCEPAKNRWPGTASQSKVKARDKRNRKEPV